MTSVLSSAFTAKPPLKQLSLLPLLLLTLTSVSLAQEDTEEELDWVKTRYVPEYLRDRQCVNCGGRYIDPLADVPTDVTPEESDIKATANSTEMQGNTVLLKGGVEVQQGYRQLRGNEATLNQDDRSGRLSGDIVVREPGVLLKGDEAEFFSKTGEATLQNSRFILHDQHIRGTALQLNRDEYGLIHIHEGNISYCAPGEHDWAIRADSMELDLEEGLGTAKGARLDVAGVPIFYSPWLRFPLDDRRRTGFLWPDIGSDTRGGLDISAPVYFNLAPNYDALYAPRFIDERGVNHELELRYLNPLIGYWSVGGAFLDNDDRYERELPEERNHDRWLGVVEHNGLFDQRWRTQVDYSKASDADYLKDLDTSSLNSKRQANLLQLGSIDYLGDKWIVDLDVQQFQSLADDIRDDYKKLPQLTAAYRGDRLPFDFDPIVLAQYSNFDSDDELRVTGERVYAEVGTTYPMLWQQGFFTPTAKYRYLEYDLDDQLIFEDETPSAGAALLSLDGGLFFERQTMLAGRNLLQTLEPRVYYLYSENEDQTEQPSFDSAELTFSYNQLFRETRFSGRDRLDDANQVSLGITTRFISEETGVEQFSASLGQIFYLEDREVRLNPIAPPLEQSGSEVAGELNFFPNERTSLRTSLQYDPYSGNMSSGNLLLNYNRGDGGVYNLGYSFRRSPIFGDLLPPTEQAHISAYVPLGSRWSAFFAWNYSVEEQESVEDMIGIEYDTCCWKFRLLHLRYFDTIPGQDPSLSIANLEREHSTQFQIVLKGMGGFGNRVEGLLDDLIRGFEERPY
ncbi:MAG: LPS-assembly protein LptD [Halieaceae bacterium]